MINYIKYYLIYKNINDCKSIDELEFFLMMDYFPGNKHWSIDKRLNFLSEFCDGYNKNIDCNLFVVMKKNIINKYYVGILRDEKLKSLGI